MSDVYTHVSHNSLGDNLLGSIKGFLVGVVLFLVAFPILWINEGLTDMSTVAKTATVVPPANPGTAGEGKLIAATGNLASADQVGDPDRLAPGNYVKLHRKVESYVWKEKKDTHTEKQLGGGSRTVTTYSYDLTWTDSPQSSSSFEHEEGHENPPVTMQEESLFAKQAHVGVLAFDPSQAELPPATKLELTPAMLAIPKPAAPAPVVPRKPAKGNKKAAAEPAPAPNVAAEDDFRFASGYLYRGTGSPVGPHLGDVRVSYEAVVPGTQVTLYGERHGNQVTPFVKDGDRLFRAVVGTHEQAMSTLHGEHVALTWMLRFLGVFCMWIGLALLLAPFNAVLDIIPFVGSAGRFVTGLVMFPVALALSSIVILVAIVAHSPILLVLTLLTFVAAGVTLVVARSKKAKNAQAAPVGGPYAQYGR